MIGFVSLLILESWGGLVFLGLEKVESGIVGNMG